MTERPILFSGAMVRALLDGTKTQTRRVVKVQPPAATHSVSTWHHPDDERKGPHFWSWGPDPQNAGLDYIQPDWAHPCPYGQAGDHLWVRETFALEAQVETDQLPPHKDGRPVLSSDDPDMPGWTQCHYRATDKAPELAYIDHDGPHCRWKPAIHMPRWASRITLEVTGVRVERLQSISRGDAMAEGCPFANMADGPDPRKWYAELWDQINGPGAWDLNPWVWIVEFRRV